ncbi:bolA-like protein 3 [Manacus vitellinus]|uniref:bolA-like protein 3 n=1 Tax=Manacus vitellinus TaxID=328815 RepID=UPI00115F17B5|nr:bolA-like protein 3 [Manacus vitellinus]
MWTRFLDMVISHTSGMWCSDVGPPVSHHCPPQLFLRCRSWRSLSSGSEGESRLTRVLRERFPRASSIKVMDISGGCGAMYEIHIESEEFREKRTVQQHQMVNQYTASPSQ